MLYVICYMLYYTNIHCILITFYLHLFAQLTDVPLDVPFARRTAWKRVGVFLRVPRLDERWKVIRWWSLFCEKNAKWRGNMPFFGKTFFLVMLLYVYIIYIYICICIFFSWWLRWFHVKSPDFYVLESLESPRLLTELGSWPRDFQRRFHRSQLSDHHPGRSPLYTQLWGWNRDLPWLCLFLLKVSTPR